MKPASGHALAAAAIALLAASCRPAGSDDSAARDAQDTAFEERAVAALKAVSKGEPRHQSSQSLRFSVTGGILSAASPVKFWSTLAYPRTVEVNHTAAPGHASIVFPWETGGLNIWLPDMRGARFYGECDIATDPVPEGSAFQPRLQERMSNGSPQSLRMTYDDTTKRWFFITSQSQIDMPILMINATDNQLPAGFNWILRSCTILPFKG